MTLKVRTGPLFGRLNFLGAPHVRFPMYRIPGVFQGTTEAAVAGPFNME